MLCCLAPPLLASLPPPSILPTLCPSSDAQAPVLSTMEDRKAKEPPPAYTISNTKLLQMHRKMTLVIGQAEMMQAELSKMPPMEKLKSRLAKLREEEKDMGALGARSEARALLQDVSKAKQMMEVSKGRRQETGRPIDPLRSSAPRRAYLFRAPRSLSIPLPACCGCQRHARRDGISEVLALDFVPRGPQYRERLEKMLEEIPKLMKKRKQEFRQVATAELKRMLEKEEEEHERTTQKIEVRWGKSEGVWGLPRCSSRTLLRCPPSDPRRQP